MKIKDRIERRKIQKLTEPITIRLDSETMNFIEQISIKHRLSKNSIISDLVSGGIYLYIHQD